LIFQSQRAVNNAKMVIIMKNRLPQLYST